MDHKVARNVAEILDKAISEIPYPDVVAAIHKYIVTPRVVLRNWDYKENTQYPCWIVAVHPESQTAIAYCEYGFGPSSPWGLLNEPSDFNEMGMDCSWYSRLEDAIRQSKMWDGELSPGYEVQ